MKEHLCRRARTSLVLAYRLSQRGRDGMGARTHGRELAPLGVVPRQAGERVREASAHPGQRLRGDLELGHQYEAESRHDREGERRPVLAWRIDDLERRRDRDHDRGR